LIPDDDHGPDLAWLSDGPVTSEDFNSAIWPTEAVDMVPLPGFTLDDDSVLVPLPSVGGDDAPADGAPIGAAPTPNRPSGRRVRLSLGARAAAGAGVLGALILTVVTVSGGIGLPPAGDSGGLQEASAPTAAPTTPSTEIDAAWIATLDRSLKASQLRARREASALALKKKRAEARQRVREPAAARTPAETRQVSSPPAPVREAPSDPWAAVPPAVREFEPGPWNLGGAS
jgi:hypothetical protein